MRAITEDHLQSMLSSGQSKALKSFRKRLSSGCDDDNFDNQALEVVKRYAWSDNYVESVRKYLNELKDPEGFKFSRSLKQYSKMEEVWEQFKGEERNNFMWNRHAKRGLEKVLERYSKAKLTPLCYSTNEDIEQAMSSLTTSSGWESILSGAVHKGDIFDKYDVLQTWRAYAEQALVDGSFNKPMLPGVRTQCSGEFNDDGSETGTCKHKTRPIWMVDVWVIISETIFGNPINDWMKTYSYSNIGKDTMWTSRWISRRRAQFPFYMSVDYSKYDSTIPSWLISAAFQVVRSMFPGMDGFCSSLLNVIETDFIHKNLITADGIVHVDHGNPSGSKLTAIINGICNEIITETWMDKFRVTGLYNIMGDDNLIYLNKQISGEVAAYIYKNFGIKVNLDKTNCNSSSVDPEYLSRIWTNLGAYRHPSILLSKLMFPEKFRTYYRGELTPEIVVYSYVLGYPSGMRQLMDVDQFMVDTRLSVQKLQEVECGFKYLPYTVREAIYSTPQFR